jgi:uncharacterized membrane-anchored protein YjiN (DUF445 family)
MTKSPLTVKDLTPAAMKARKNIEKIIYKFLDRKDVNEMIRDLLNEYDRKEQSALIDELTDRLDSSLKDIFPDLYTKTVVKKMKEGQSMSDLQAEILAVSTVDEYFHEGRRKAVANFVYKKFEEWKLETSKFKK